MLTTRKRQRLLTAIAAGALARGGAVLHHAGASGMAWSADVSAHRGGTPQ